MRNSIIALQAESRVKYDQLKRDLDSRVARLENDLLNAKETVQARDTAVAERDRLIRQQTEQLTEGTNHITRLSAENDARQAKLAKQESAYASLDQQHSAARSLLAEQEKRSADDAAKLAQLEPIPAALAKTKEKLAQALKTLEAAQTRVDRQDQEVSRLHKRTVELEPLTIAVKDREAKLLDLEARLAEAVRVREAEIAQLKKRVAELEPLPQRLADAESKQTKLMEELAAMRRAKDAEIETLQEKLGAIVVLRQRLAEHDAHALQAREQAIAAIRDADLHRASSGAELAAMRQALVEREAVLEQKAEMAQQLHQQLAELALLPESLRQRDSSLLELETQFADRSRQIDQLHRESAERDHLKEGETQRLRAQIAQLEPLIDAVTAQSARALELERGIHQREQQIRREAREIDGLRAELLRWLRLAGALPARDAEIARLRVRLQLYLSGSKIGNPISRADDDLKRIRGIGPALERMLHNEGVVSFKQIAHWTAGEVGAMAVKLGSFTNRIVRDDWIGQAKAEHFDKYGERLGE